MKYVYLANNAVGEILCTEDPIFPGIPIEQRYSAAFLADCITVDDTVAATLHSGMLYDAVANTFSEPPAPSVDENPDQVVDPAAGETQQTYAEKLETLTTENNRLQAQVKLQSEQLTMLGDCVLEMGDTVYA